MLLNCQGQTGTEFRGVVGQGFLRKSKILFGSLLITPSPINFFVQLLGGVVEQLKVRGMVAEPVHTAQVGLARFGMLNRWNLVGNRCKRTK